MVPQCHLSNHGLFDTPRAFSHFSTRCCYLGRLTAASTCVFDLGDRQHINDTSNRHYTVRRGKQRP